MKQAILNLKKKLLLIELPEGAKDIKISTLGDIIFKTSGTKEVVWLADDRVVRKCIGKLTDIRESQFAKWVEEFEGRFENYESLHYTSPGSEFNLLTAKESFLSYMESVGVYFKNPLADYEGQMKNFRKQFEEAEEKVWQLSQTYIFQILN